MRHDSSIAILGGEKEERAGLDKLLGNVIVTWAKMAGQYMRTMFVSHGNFVIASVIPIILPSTCSGTPEIMNFGGVPSRFGQFCRTRS